MSATVGKDLRSQYHRVERHVLPVSEQKSDAISAQQRVGHASEREGSAFIQATFYPLVVEHLVPRQPSWAPIYQSAVWRLFKASHPLIRLARLQISYSLGNDNRLIRLSSLS
jgi:hypothetical protein